MKQVIALLISILLSALIFSSCNRQENKDKETTAEKNDTMTQPLGNKADDKEEVEKAETPLTETPSGLKPLNIVVDNLKSPDAPVVVGVYGTKNKFLDTSDQLKEYRFIPKNGKLVAQITDLQYGDLAMALYQDVNSDGKIDKNLIGIPEEPYAFSNNYKPVAKAPNFKDCKFSYNAEDHSVHISMLK